MLSLAHYLSFLLVVSYATAATVSYTFDIGWMNYNVDGLITRYDFFTSLLQPAKSTRPIIAINGQWPTPTIRGNVGDTINVAVTNNLGNQSITIHWHGLLQSGNNHNDGTPMVAQCPIIPGSSYTYSFTLQAPGTYWYHSHSEGQYMCVNFCFSLSG